MEGWLSLPLLKVQHRHCLIVVPYTEAQWEVFLTKYLVNVFSGVNIQCDIFDSKLDAATINTKVQELITLISQEETQYDFIFTFNRMPSNSVTVGDGEIELYSLAQTPVITWIVDNIGHHIFTGMVRNLEGEEIILLSDRSNIDIAGKYGLDVSKASFFPAWGPERKSGIRNISERNKTVLFSGDLEPEVPLSDLCDEIAGDDIACRKIIDRAVESRIEHCGDHDSFTFISNLAIDYDRVEVIGKIYPSVDRWLRQFFRRDMLRRIKSFPITICGNIADDQLLSQPNVTVIGRTAVSEVERLSENVGIFLDDPSAFVDGINIRPSIAFSNGCVLASSGNQFMKKQFPPGSYLELGIRAENIEERISDAFADTNALDHMDKTAAEYYEHTRTQTPTFLTETSE